MNNASEFGRTWVVSKSCRAWKWTEPSCTIDLAPADVDAWIENATMSGLKVVDDRNARSGNVLD
jgi:hypothetical protein